MGGIHHNSQLSLGKLNKDGGGGTGTAPGIRITITSSTTTVIKPAIKTYLKKDLGFLLRQNNFSTHGYLGIPTQISEQMLLHQ